jgi:hypothetical protein
MYKNCDIYFIITTRYNYFSNISNSDRFNRTNQELNDNFNNSKRIICDIIKTENFFIWNYETMLFMPETYFKLLWNFLKIETDYFPLNIKDGNFKYLK